MIDLIAAVLITLHGPNGQQIVVNPKQVVTLRSRRDSGSYVAQGIKCLIHTTDGKIVNVIEDCAVVKRMLGVE